MGKETEIYNRCEMKKLVKEKGNRTVVDKDGKLLEFNGKKLKDITDEELIEILEYIDGFFNLDGWRGLN